MAKHDADRNLLVGIIALQMEFVTRDQLVAAMNAWVLTKHEPLGRILLQQGALPEDDLAALEDLVRRHLKRHDDDPEKSLASLSSLGSVRAALEQVADPDLHASLLSVGADRDDGDPNLTRTFTAGASTSAGSRFRVVRPHAKGGLGVVSVAVDTELDREVALKEIQDDHADQPASRGRFMLEAQITGKLEHPGVIPVYGLGQDPTGRPYYAMRFIRGDSLKEAIQHFHGPAGPREPGARQLQLRELLGRFIDVCNAIAYAHVRGVLHRDLKPGNVMLGPFGETLVVDWGLAKASGRREIGTTSAEPTLRITSGSGTEETLPGSTIGTPGYMSPEQARGELDRLGPASDVYSLGATLYTLLTGRAAFDDPDVAAILRKVSRGEFPAPRSVSATVPRPLEAICLRAMAARPEDRYATAKDLAADVKRWLADEPVSAWREPFLLRAGRWARRHRPLVATAAGVVLITAAAASFVAWERSRHARALDVQRLRAEAGERQAIDAVKRFGDVVTRNPELKNNPKLAALRKALLKEPLAFFRTLRDQLKGQRKASRESLSRLASAASELAFLTYEIGDEQDALRAFQEALAIRQRLASGNPNVTEFQSDLATSHNNIGLLQHATGRPADALLSFGRALAIRERLARENPTVTKLQNDLAASHNNIGLVQHATGRPTDALVSFGKALAIRERLARENPTVTEIQNDLAGSQYNIGFLQREAGWPADALVSHRKALAIWDRLARENPTVAGFEIEIHLAASHNNIGLIQSETGRLADGLVSYSKALASQERLARENPTVTELQRDLATSHNNIGLLQSRMGRLAHGLVSLGKALAIRERLARENPTVTELPSDLATTYNSIGLLQSDTGRPADGLVSFGKALAIRELLARENPNSPHFASELGETLYHIAKIDLNERRPAEARARLLRAIEIQQKALTAYPDHPKYRGILANSYTNLIQAAEALGKPDEVTATQRALEQFRSSDPQVVALDAGLAAVLKGARHGPPADVSQLLQLANRAYEKALHGAAARLYAEALERDPKLAVDLRTGHRYNAACAAALAGCGKCKDDPPPDPAARAALRGQALDWLRADLDAWRKIAADNRAETTLVPTLRHWREDSDLAGLRDERELAKLPEADRDASRKLWADVDALLRGVSGAIGPSEPSPRQLPGNPFAP